MSYKDLALYRNKIVETIESYPDFINMTTKEIPTGVQYTIEVKGQQHPAMLCEYRLKTGDTTLHYGVGRNQELSQRIADDIKDKCKCPVYANKVFHLKKIGDEELEVLIEFLKDEGATIDSEKPISFGRQYIVSHPDGGILYINKFDSGAFSVQGTSAVLKSIVVAALTTLLPYEEVIKMQLDAYEIKTEPKQILSELHKRLPQSYTYLGETLQAIISPSIGIATFPYELDDYSVMVFPALRGLEGYIKKLFLDNGIKKLGLSFGDYFTNNPSAVEINPDYRKIINNPKIIKTIEETYKFYKDNRHSLFHVDGTLIENTRILDNKQEAMEMLDDVLNLIETSYSNIIKK